MKFDDVIATVGVWVGVIISFFVGAFWGYFDGQKDGYIQCLQDIKKGNPPAYVLVEQADGTTKWESNKEKGREK
jgi:ABC-type dipeptide/oligopeptide/nickel transport system permease subunit